MNIEKCFKNLMVKNQLSHAYLLWGYGDSAGRVAAARGLAAFLEHGVWDAPEPLIDCLVVQPAHDSIGIDATRDAIRFIWQKPMRSSRKTIIVVDVECMTPEAQNASLKMVEEPPARGLFIGIVRDPALLVPTLVSRFQKIYMPVKDSGFRIQDSGIAEDIVTFLKASTAKRKAMIKQLVEDSIEDSGAVKAFVVGLMAELDKNPVKNYYILKELVHRWTLMNQITVNKRLQLEAVNQWIKN